MALNPLTDLAPLMAAGPFAVQTNAESLPVTQSGKLDFTQLFHHLLARSVLPKNAIPTLRNEDLTKAQQEALAQFLDALDNLLTGLKSLSREGKASGGTVQKTQPARQNTAATLTEALQAFYIALQGSDGNAPRGTMPSFSDWEHALASLLHAEKGGHTVAAPGEQASSGHVETGVLVAVAHLLQQVEDRLTAKQSPLQMIKTEHDGHAPVRQAAIIAARQSQVPAIQAEVLSGEETETEKTARDAELSFKNAEETAKAAPASTPDYLLKRLAALQARLHKLMEHTAQSAREPRAENLVDAMKSALSGLQDSTPSLQALPAWAQELRMALQPRSEHPLVTQQEVVQRFEKLATQFAMQHEGGQGETSAGNGQSGHAGLLQRSDSGQSMQGVQSAITLPLRHPDWGKALAQRVMVLAQNNQQLAQVRLHPAHLGPIQIKLKVDKDQSVQVSLHAHHALTREAIEQALPRLREMFDQQGLNLAAIDVSPDAQSHAQAFADARREGQAESETGSSAHADAGVETDETPPQPRWVRADALVDHFV